MPANTAPDDAIRGYLQFLADPDQLVDTHRITELQTQLDTAEDPLERLKLLAALERARQPNEADYRDAFIQHAKTWADQHHVTATAFEQMNVPRPVLIDAGLIDRRGRRTPTAGASGVSAEHIKTVISTMTGPFTSLDVVNAAGGGSPMTIRKAISQLVDEGSVRRLGPDPNWHHKGRAPILYEHIP